MIANITSGNSFSGVIMYNEKKVQKGKAERLYSNVYGLGSSTQKLIECLETVAAKRPEMENKTFHVSLAFAAGDKLSQEELIDLGSKYMDEMGFRDTPYITYRHHDTGIDHLHIVSTKVDLDGNKISDSMERFRSQRIARKLEVEYGITIVSSIKDKETDLKKAESDVKSEREINTKHTISLAIHQALNADKATSYEGFVRSLLKRNVVVQLVKVDSEGNNLITPGIMYSLGRRVKPETKRVKGSAFHQGYTYSKVLNMLDSNLIVEQTKPAAERSKADLKKITTSILNELKSPAISTVTDLDKLFAKYKLEAIYSKNSGGIYGLKIKDLTSNEVYKASDIDRGFSWNLIRKLLDGAESDQFRSASRPAKTIPFVVNVSHGPDEKPLNWIKSVLNKGVIANPIINVVNHLSMRGFVSQNELDSELRKIGFKATFLRDFSKDSGGITGIAFTELATGNTYSGSTLNHKQLSWNNLSRFVANDRAESTFDNYVQSVLSNWSTIKATTPQRRMEDFLTYINQCGITVSNENGIDYLSQIGGNAKISLESVVTDRRFKAIFHVSDPILETATLVALDAVGYIHKPLTPVERAILSAVYNNDRSELIKLINAGERIDLRKVTTFAAAQPGIATYKDITNVQQQMAKTLKFALFCSLALDDDQSAADDKLPFETFVQSLNKRGIGVGFDLSSTDGVENISFHLKGKPDTVLAQNELPDLIKSGNVDSMINLQSTSSYKKMVDESGGFDINYTAGQLHLFKAVESGTMSLEMGMIREGVTLVLTNRESVYFEVQDEFEQQIEDSYDLSEPIIKWALSFIEALVEVAQGEVPVSRDERKRKDENKKRKLKR